MRYITFFYIFLIFTQNFLLTINYCDKVLIDYSDYDFSVFSKGNHAYQKPYPVNGKRVFAFDYFYYLQKSFNDDIKAKVNLSTNKIKNNEKLKFKPGLVSHIINFFTGKESQIEKTLKNNELSEILCDDNFMKNVNEYRKDKAEASSASSVIKKSAYNSLISGVPSGLLYYGK